MRALRSLLSACVGALFVFAATANAAAPTTLEARIKQMEDHMAIERLLMEYGRSLDDRDFAAYSHLFATNGEWIGGGGLGPFKGQAAIQAGMEKAFSAATDIPKGTNFHLLTNAIIDIKGDHATASSKWVFVRMQGAKPEASLAGRYEDELIRENGSWRFLRRVAK
jgi:uncharacterized protein (TIGR02246 family)